MATAGIILFKSKVHKDGTHPVVMRITHKGERKYFTLGKEFRSTVKQWNQDAGRFNSIGDTKKGTERHEKHRILNPVLNAKQKAADDILSEMEREGTEFTFRSFEGDFRNEGIRKSLTDYFDRWISEFERTEKVGNALAYRNAKSAVERFRPGLKLREVNPIVLRSFEAWLRVQGLKETSMSAYFRTLRSLMNKAISEGIIKDSDYPFSRSRSDTLKFRISKLSTKTQKRAIPKDQMEKIKRLRFKKGSKQHLAHQVFLFSYYTRGMNFIDIAFLRWSDIKGDRIRYIRRKTGKEFSLPLLPQTVEILTYFKDNHISPGGYVFPILDDSVHRTIKQKYTRVRTVLRDVNKQLKEVAILIGQKDLKLTTYVSRHSYATIMKYAKVSTSIISQALGHQTEAITQTYLDDFDNETIDKAEASIL